MILPKTNRRLHKALGLLLLIPLIGWSLTGLIFLFKPGYANAYEKISVKTHPLPAMEFIPNPTWEELRILKTTIGTHFLVKSNGQNLNIDPFTNLPAKIPNAETLKTLFDEAIAHNQNRYGKIIQMDSTTASTSTGIKLQLDWNTLSFSQIGQDRRIINILYKIHYLQWSPWPLFNKILGVAGLFLLACLILTGVRFILPRRK